MKTIFGIVVVILMILAGSFLLVSPQLSLKAEYDINTLDKGWQVYRNGKQVYSGKLSKYHTVSPEPGETFTLVNKLEGCDVPCSCIYFRGLQSMVRVYLNDEQIFEQGAREYKKGLMIGRTLCYVPLPYKHSGKTIKIEITAGEKNAFTSLGPFLHGNQHDLFKKFISERQLPHLFGTFLTLFALFQLVCAPYLIYKNRLMARQLFSALLVLCVGTYMLAFYNIFNLYITNQQLNTFLEFLSIYGIPFAISGYLQYVIKTEVGSIYRIITIMNGLLLGIVLFLHLTNMLHISNSLMPMYALCAIEIVPFAVYVGTSFGKRDPSVHEDWMEDAAEVLPVLGIVFFVTSSFVDMGSFLYDKHILHEETSATILFATIGGMVLALCQMVSFLLQGVMYLRSAATKEHLVSMAYTDPLTGLPNRSSCEQALSALTGSKTPYTIISIDVDSLKKVNDQYGHARGDDMLINFSRDIDSVFGRSAMVGRMGGDEFLIILNDTPRSLVDQKLEQLYNRLSLRNTEGGIKYSVSCGVAESSETKLGKRAYDIYLLADQRMYEIKRKRHVKMEGEA